MPVHHPSHARALQDREIMLRCLADAATGTSSDLTEGRPGHRLLQLRLRSTLARRAATSQREEARAMRDPLPPAPRLVDRALSHLAMGRLVLDLRRADLLRHRCDADDLRNESRALRAEAEQVRRRGRQRLL